MTLYRHGLVPKPSALLLLSAALLLPSIAVAKPAHPDIVIAHPAIPAPVIQQTPVVDVVAIPVPLPLPLPLPGQLKPLPIKRSVSRRHSHAHAYVPTGAQVRVGRANEAARVQPVRDGFINAIQLYAYADGALYQVYAAPGQISDIMLQAGEKLVGAGPVAAGDTVRWIIGDTVSGTGVAERVHIMVKPTRSDLITNMIINTDRRTYHLELRSNPTTYMASVSWDYPQDQLIAIRRAEWQAQAAAPIASGIDLAALHFNYEVSGDKVSWRPLRAFDDGTRTFIEFPESIAQGEMPPIFVVGSSGDAELVNYRVSDHHMIVDRLFAAAELRLGDGKAMKAVRITRSPAKVRR